MSNIREITIEQAVSLIGKTVKVGKGRSIGGEIVILSNESVILKTFPEGTVCEVYGLESRGECGVYLILNIGGYRATAWPGGLEFPEGFGE